GAALLMSGPQPHWDLRPYQANDTERTVHEKSSLVLLGRVGPMYFFRVVPYEGQWRWQRGAPAVEGLHTYAEAIYLAESEAAMHRASEVHVEDETGHVEVVARFAPLE